MASAVDDDKKALKHKKKTSKELLKPPIGPGVSFMQKELPTTQNSKNPLITGPPKTYRVEKSSVLSQVQSFLPVMKEADKELQRRLQGPARDEIDIEKISEGDPYIKMDLAVMPFLQHMETRLSEEEDSDSTSSSGACSDSGTEDVNSSAEMNIVKRTRKRKMNAISDELDVKRR